ncbi:hypothetical protein CVT24_009883 [Panaeolus cyanescens]|uniref:Uncharacterized protein n=1 Tax=Panaeolus cyanescens TaxID=181874 RepID=A0A409WWH7_9AGAR|nr:hypothetical protein CVT24_009883 [Panaeolus cyanescens]
MVTLLPTESTLTIPVSGNVASGIEPLTLLDVPLGDILTMLTVKSHMASEHLSPEDKKDMDAALNVAHDALSKLYAYIDKLERDTDSDDETYPGLDIDIVNAYMAEEAERERLKQTAGNTEEAQSTEREPTERAQVVEASLSSSSASSSSGQPIDSPPSYASHLLPDATIAGPVARMQLVPDFQNYFILFSKSVAPNETAYYPAPGTTPEYMLKAFEILHTEVFPHAWKPVESFGAHFDAEVSTAKTASPLPRSSAKRAVPDDDATPTKKRLRPGAVEPPKNVGAQQTLQESPDIEEGYFSTPVNRTPRRRSTVKEATFVVEEAEVDDEEIDGQDDDIEWPDSDEDRKQNAKPLTVDHDVGNDQEDFDDAASIPSGSPRIDLVDVEEDAKSNFTTFTTLTGREIPQSNTFISWKKVKKMLGDGKNKCIVAAENFVRVGPFVNVGAAPASAYALDPRNRVVLKDTGGTALCMMVGGVQNCDLVHGGPPNLQYPDYVVKRITITPTQISAIIFRQTLRKLFNKPSLKVPFESETEITFSTKKDGAKISSPVKNKSSALYGPDSGDESSEPVSKSWYTTHIWPSVLDFDTNVPIYDATGKDFLFDKASFENLRALPLYPRGKATQKLDIPVNSIVAVGFTSNLWGGSDTTASSLSLNVQFVIVLRILKLAGEN